MSSTIPHKLPDHLTANNALERIQKELIEEMKNLILFVYIIYCYFGQTNGSRP